MNENQKLKSGKNVSLALGVKLDSNQSHIFNVVWGLNFYNIRVSSSNNQEDDFINNLQAGYKAFNVLRAKIYWILSFKKDQRAKINPTEFY